MVNNIENAICDAVDILVDKALQDASFDRTITGTIIKQDENIPNAYKIKYQDSSFWGYTQGFELYEPGQRVHVLIPANDSDNNKIILGKSFASHTLGQTKDLESKTNKMFFSQTQLQNVLFEQEDKTIISLADILNNLMLKETQGGN